MAALLRTSAEQAAFEQAALDERLWDAAEKGDVAAIERLAAEGASPDAKDERGDPAVATAALKGHAGAVSALVRLGADPDARNSVGDTALMSAAAERQVECVRALLAGGADRTLRSKYGGKTALEVAEEELKSDGEQKGEAEVVALLRE